MGAKKKKVTNNNATKKAATKNTVENKATKKAANQKTMVKKAAVKKTPVKKTSVSQKSIKKSVTKNPAGNKVAKKITIKKTDKTSTDNSKIKVTLEQRHKMICEAAYYISLDKTYETVNPTDDWLQAESFIEQICTVHKR